MIVKMEQVFTETYEILKNIPESIVCKIPLSLRNIIENERDKNYNVEIKKPLKTSDFKYETIVFLGIIYNDYLKLHDNVL